MNGGHFNYADSRLYEWSQQVRRDGNPLLADLLHDLGDLLHEYDWWQSGDTGRKKWLNAWESWQKKWLNAWESWQKKWMGGNPAEMTIDAIKDSVRQMAWDSLGKPADKEYKRICEKMRGW